MNVGLTIFVTTYTIDIVSLARHAERLGFDSIWVPEHPIIPADMKTPWPGSKEGVLPDWYKRTIDPFVGLAAAAGATTKLRLGTGICLVPERDPLYTAKEVATLDQVSKGRFEFGIGAGWLKEESDVFGVDFPRRWTQTRDHVLAMKALWKDELSEYQGRYVKFPKLWCHPKPFQKPHPPVLIAGELEKSAQRVADFGDGWFPRGRAIDPKGLEAGRKKIEQLYRERGRDPKTLNISVFAAPPDKALNRQFTDAGATRVIHLLPSESEAKVLPMMEKWAAELL
jgi:probable F420-dependent oxidoreductase